MTDMERFARAFERWETGYRAEPAKFFTTEEVAAMQVSQLSADRAAYFVEMLAAETQPESA